MIFDILSTVADPVATFAQSGLKSVTDEALQNWIRPVFLVGVAVVAIIFIKDRAWMKLISFLGIAAIVGTIVFFGDSLFGSGGSLSGVGKRVGQSVNVVDAYQLTPIAQTTTQVV